MVSTRGKHRLKRPPLPILALLLAIVGVEGAFQGAEAGLWLTEFLRFFGFRLGAFVPALLTGTAPVYEAQPWAMFVTHIFVHVGPLHMLGNAVTLYILWYLMPWMYVFDFVLVFLGGALGGALMFYWLGDPGSVMTGASGGVAALAGVWALYEMFLVHQGHILSIRPKRTAVLVGLVVGGVLLSLDRQIGTAWQAHAGGALAGAGFGAGLIARAIWEGRYGPYDRRPPSTD